MAIENKSGKTSPMAASCISRLVDINSSVPAAVAIPTITAPIKIKGE